MNTDSLVYILAVDFQSCWTISGEFAQLYVYIYYFFIQLFFFLTFEVNSTKRLPKVEFYQFLFGNLNSSATLGFLTIFACD